MFIILQIIREEINLLKIAISYNVFLLDDYEQVKQNIISSLTLKVIPVISNNKKRFEVMIIIDQLNKYCTYCENFKENIHFTNKINEVFSHYSNFESYMFSFCNECFGNKQKNILIKPLNFIVKKLFKYMNTEEAYKNKISMEKEFNKIKKEKLLNIYFIIKCKLGKDLAQYIFLFVKKNILCDVRQ
jgi:hypothetical protein